MVKTPFLLPCPRNALQNITPDFTLSAGAIFGGSNDSRVTLAEGAAQPFTVLAEDGQTRKNLLCHGCIW